MSKARDKRIAYVQAALKEDQVNNPNRSLSEFVELTKLIGDQYDDKISFSIKRNNQSEDVLDRKDTKSIEDCKTIAVGIDGNKVWSRYTKE